MYVIASTAVPVASAVSLPRGVLPTSLAGHDAGEPVAGTPPSLPGGGVAALPSSPPADALPSSLDPGAFEPLDPPEPPP